MLLFKATEELNNVLEHAKQRHHLIGQYVVGRQGLVQDLGTKDQGISDFLKKFYTSNYVWNYLNVLWLLCSHGILLLGLDSPNKDVLKIVLCIFTVG